MTTLVDAALPAPLRSAAEIRAAHDVAPAYRADIDGLRAIAVVAVLVFHFFPSALPGGFVGVDIFFVISGYLISQIIIGGLETESFSFAGFYARRVRRLFPALILVLTASLAFGWMTLFRAEYAELGEHAVAGAAFLANFAFWSESGYFDKAAIAKPLLHLWSLGVEEQFYVFWPVVLALAWRMRANLLLVTGVIGVASFGANLFATATAPAAAFYSPWTRFWELMMGAMLACLAMHRPERPTWDLTGRPRFASTLSAAGIALIALGIVFAREKGFPGWQALLPTGGTALLILAGPGAVVNRMLLSRGVFVAIGLISYPLYLWHWPLASFARIVHGDPGPTMRAALLATSVGLAWATYAGIERHVKRAGRRAGVTATLVLLLLAVAAAGNHVLAARGLPERAIVKVNVALDEAKASLRPRSAVRCAGQAAAHDERFQCFVDRRAAPRFALLGDSKAGAVFGGLFATSSADATWLFLGSGTDAPLVPVLSDSPTYGYVSQATVDKTLRVIESTPSVEAVVIATATRALFNLGNDYSIADLPRTRNFETALAGLDATVMRLLAAGKRVVLLVDNPTFPHVEDCIGRRTSSTLLDRLLTAAPPPECRISIARHLEWSRPYRELLRAIEQRHPGKVSLFDTVPLLCDEAGGFCTFKDGQGRPLYGVTDHISAHAAVIVGRAVNARLRGRPEP